MPSIGPPASPAPGQLIGDYRVVRQLGQGRAGVVLEAAHKDSGQAVAIKILFPAQGPQSESGFSYQARALSLLRHPGLCEIIEFGLLPQGGDYLVMELVSGETLRQRLQTRGRLGEPEVLGLCRRLAQALAAAHAEGTIHANLHPGNVMLVQDGQTERTKVLDLGLARIAAGGPEGAPFQSSGGAIMGLPAYLAPEQCSASASLDGKTDVYALGVMLYEMLSGRVPFFAARPSDILVMHLQAEATPLRDLAPSVSEDTAALVHALLAKDPAGRPAMSEVAEILEALDQGAGATRAMPTVEERAAPQAPGRATAAWAQAVVQQRMEARRKSKSGRAGGPGGGAAGARRVVVILGAMVLLGLFGAGMIHLARRFFPDAPSKTAAPVRPPVKAAPGDPPAPVAPPAPAAAPPQREDKAEAAPEAPPEKDQEDPAPPPSGKHKRHHRSHRKGH